MVNMSDSKGQDLDQGGAATLHRNKQIVNETGMTLAIPLLCQTATGERGHRSQQ